eukprot:TRINITY_DN10836_c0_g1_i1.p1 TRINITY_DN10836_c0_g1~~TRINITY_DN10836_c0_g1_i1.p1  ORF type:complete len:546 (-),score=82.39 TRINITY_DN10836_c0_g1_i1:42-1550(-)
MGANVGEMIVSSGATLAVSAGSASPTFALRVLAGGTATLNSNCDLKTLNISGTVNVGTTQAVSVNATATYVSGSGSLTLNAAYTNRMQLDSMSLAGGASALSIGTTSILSVAKLFSWLSGSVLGGGKMNLLATCRSSVTGSAALPFTGELQNYGLLQYAPTGTTGLQLATTASIFRNQGVVNITGPAATYFSSFSAANSNFFNNAGTLLVNVPATVTFGLKAILNNTGSLIVNSGDFKPYSITMRGGVMTVNANAKVYVSPHAQAASPALQLALSGGYIQGTGIVYGTVNQTGGVVRPGYANPGGAIGTLTIDTLSQTAQALTEIAFSSASVSSKLLLSVGFNMGGTLSMVSLCPYFPTTSDSYAAVITYPSAKTGSYVVSGDHVAYNAVYNSFSLDVAATSVSIPAYACGACDHGSCCSTSVCTCQTGWTGTSCNLPLCGDGILIEPEGCDDGNLMPGDGCSETCAVESGYICSGAGPTSCAPNCGDRLVTGAETCDDGNS